MSVRLNTSVRAALGLLAPFLVLGAFVSLLPLQDPSAQALARQLEPPSWQHPFGTDGLGRDLFARVLFGVRSSLLIGVLAAIVSLVIGVSVGATAGWVGRRVDAALMRFVDFLYGVPFVCLVIFVMAVLRDHEPALREIGITRATIVYLAVGCTTWLTMARLVRNEVVRLKALPFVEAARALGVPGTRILVSHVLKNAAGLIAVALTLTVPSILLYEAFLSFLGLGLEPPAVSLGLLAADGVGALSPLSVAWWMVVFPGGALALLLLGFSLLGDGLRDALDPASRGR